MLSPRERRRRTRTTAGATACDAFTCQETAGTMSKSPPQRLLPAALLVHILIAACSASVVSAFVGPALSFGPHAAMTISTSVRRHVSSPSSGTGDDASPSTDERSDEWDLKSSKGRSKRDVSTFSGRYVNDNGLEIVTEKDGRVTARPAADSVPSGGSGRKTEIQEAEVTSTSAKEEDDIASAEVELVESISTLKPLKKVQSSEEDADASASEGKRRIVIRGNKPKPIVPKKQLTEHPVQTSIPSGGFNVVLTHCTADFDSLASAVGLAKLWSSEGSPVGGKAALSDDNGGDSGEALEDDAYKSSSTVPTFVVLPRGAHPGVQKFLALHKHLFPIRSLKSLPSDLSSLNRLGLVDAQRRDRLGPAEPLLGHANRVTIVDHVSYSNDMASLFNVFFCFILHSYAFS